MRDDGCLTLLLMLFFCQLSGSIKTGAEVEIVGYSKTAVKTACTGVEMFKKSMDYGQAGDNVGLLLRGVKRDDIRRGQLVTAPGTMNVYTNFEAEIYVLTQQEGGRHTPFFTHYRYVYESVSRQSFPYFA